MTQRKPSSVSVEDWVERQIREAEAVRAFADLPGAGKPIPDIDKPRHELGWVADYLRRENVEVSSLLPPALSLGKEVEDLRVRLVRQRSEPEVRAIVEDLNARIDRAHAAPQLGPPFRVKRVRVDLVLDQWRSDRAESEQAAIGQATAEPIPAVSSRWPRLRRWLRLRRRNRDVQVN